MHTFTFLLVLSVKMAHKTKGGKANRDQKDLRPDSGKNLENVDPSQGSRTVIEWSPCSPFNCLRMSAQYQCDITGNARTPFDSCVGPYYYPKSLRIVRFFCPRDDLKSCVVRTIIAHRAASDLCAMPVRGTCNVTYDVSTGLRFLKCVIGRS